MRRWIAVGAVGIVACGSPSSGGPEGTSTALDRRGPDGDRLGRALGAIVGGEETTDYPAVGYVSSEYDGYSAGCTATLVANDAVLTAGHCIEERNGDRLRRIKVTFAARVETATTWHEAKSWATHPNYGKPQPGDDVYYINRGFDCALVRLAQPIVDVTPVKWSSNVMDGTFVGRRVTQVGYGFTGGNYQGSGIKRRLRTTIGEVYDGVLGLAQNGTGTCQGDSGGPTLLEAAATEPSGDTRVVGISSYGSAGCPGGGWMSRTELCAAWIDAQLGTVAGESE